MTKYKRNLDDQAKIFSLSFNKQDTSIFRISITLKEKINPQILKETVNETMKYFKDFKVKLRYGLFMYKLVENNRDIIIHKNEEYDFTSFHNKDNNYYLFKINYEDNTISIDYLHLLTDGLRANKFLTEIAYKYIEINNKLDESKDKVVYKAYNAYTSNYPKKTPKPYKVPFAFRIKGTKLNTEEISVNKIKINLPELKEYSKKQNVSITNTLISLLTYAIYNSYYKKSKSKRSINICVPIDLNNIFKEDTISNFVSHMMLTIKPNKNKEYTLTEINELVKEEFNKKLSKESILATMKSDGKLINNPFVNIIPLPLKKLVVVIGSHIFKRTFTITLTNLGKISYDSKYEKYIKDTSVILPPDWCEPIRCAISSFNETLTFTFASNIEEQYLQKSFIKELNNLKIKYTIANNDINP
ncbi:MAG: hypothetical protein ACI4OP_06640 [Candidatus Coprovivens sp.]